MLRLTVTGSITGPSGSPAPTGTVVLSSGSYASAKTTLSGGVTPSYSIAIPASSLSAGTDTLTVTYSGDNYYVTGNNTATVTVTKLTPTVTVTPASTSSNSLTVAAGHRSRRRRSIHAHGNRHPHQRQLHLGSAGPGPPAASRSPFRPTRSLPEPIP